MDMGIKYFFSETVLPKTLINSFEAIVAVQNITLIANKETYFPDPIVITYKFTYLASDPLDRIDPSAIIDDDDEEEIGNEGEDEEEEVEQAKFLEYFQAVIYKSGDWTGLSKPNITINVYSDAIDVNYDEIKDISNVEIVKNGETTSNNNKGDKDNF